MRTLLSFVVAASVAFAQPRVVNGTADVRAAQGSVLSQIRAAGSPAGPVWIGFTFPVTPGDRSMCCWHNDGNSSYRGCSLEPARGVPVQGAAGAAKPIPLEGPREAYVLFRVEGGALTKMRTLSLDCEVDAAGTALVWIQNVTSAASLEGIRQLIQSESNEKLRESCMHILSIHRDPAALPLLFDTARSDRNAKLRGSALFWISQRAGDKAAAAIRNAVENDPEMQVKEKAVFALSQLPKDQGIPLLVELAKTNKSPQVRKKAIFWLGQSKDPRALEFFEQLLVR